MSDLHVHQEERSSAALLTFLLMFTLFGDAVLNEPGALQAGSAARGVISSWHKTRRQQITVRIPG